jgi:flagellin
MALFVNTNVSALNGQKNLMNVTNRMNSSFEKLSSGSRINSAKDDAAGLQISDRLTTQIIGLKQGTRNANDGISIAQIAEGALAEVTNNVQRMRQLAVQGGNRTLSVEDRDALGQEFTKLLNVNNDIADRTAFGTMKILNYNSPEAGFQIQSGAQSGEQDTVTTGNAMLTSLFGKILQDESITGVNISLLSAQDLSALGTLGEVTAAYMLLNNISDKSVALDAIFGGTDLAAEAGQLSDLTQTSAWQIDVDEFTKLLTYETSSVSAGNHSLIFSGVMASHFIGIGGSLVASTGYTDEQLNAIHGFATDALLDTMSNLVTQVDKLRAKMGAEQNGLASTIRSNTTAVVNVSDSRSRITDTDFAAETAELTRNQIIQQASTSILAQANQLPQAALSLLGG